MSKQNSVQIAHARLVQKRRRRRLARASVALAVYLVAAGLVATTTARTLHDRSQAALYAGTGIAAAPNVTPQYLVLMVLDGARPDYFHLATLPHVDALRAQGTEYTNAFAGLLEAETPSGHAAIATGSRPDLNGILGFDWANDNDRYSLFSPDKMTALESIMRSERVPTLAGLYKARHPGAKVVAVSGHKYYAAAPLGGPSADAIMYYEGQAVAGNPAGHYVPAAVPGYMPPARVLQAPGLVYPTTTLKDGIEDHLTTNLALAAFHTMRPRMLLINYPEFDWPLGHVDGGILDPGVVVTDMREFDADLGRIEQAYRRAGILDKTLFVITADHGMMPITRWIPSSILDNALKRAGTTSVDTAVNSGQYVWLAEPARAQAVADNVAAAGDPDIQSVYYLSTSGGRPHYVAVHPNDLTAVDEATNQYLLSALLNGHEPHVVVFGTEGATFTDPSTKWQADHGGNSWQSQHVPLVLAGPGIKQGMVDTAPAQIEDIAPTALTDMGVRPRGMEGHVLTDALTRPAARDQKARLAEIKSTQSMAGSTVVQSAAGGRE